MTDSGVNPESTISEKAGNFDLPFSFNWIADFE
jgi:hypothetical protein